MTTSFQCSMLNAQRSMNSQWLMANALPLANYQLSIAALEGVARG